MKRSSSSAGSPGPGDHQTGLVAVLNGLNRVWQSDPQFKHRASGGLRALDGFHYQLAVSLEQFFKAVLEGQDDGAAVGFEVLSDLAKIQAGVIYLTQAKTTLTWDSLKSAVAEALAIDEFMEKTFPGLRSQVRFNITTRRIRGSVPRSPGKLTAADLGLVGAMAGRWDAVRGRCQDVEVTSPPKVRLAIRLWKHVARPLALIEQCVGHLVEALAAGAGPSRIQEDLLKLWEESRLGPTPQMHLFGVGEVTVSAEMGGRRIVHGVRPTIDDLRDGCFMDRHSKLEDALRVWHTGTATDAFHDGVVPVFWIEGPSGAGKSVLLLQFAQELLARGAVDAVNYVESYARALPSALEHARNTPVSVAVVGDDLYSPENRDPAIWDAVGMLAATGGLPPGFAIATCGPSEQREAFEKECERHRALKVVPILLKALGVAERAAYHEWYQTRTGTTVSCSQEPIFVAAAWTYELAREQQITPTEFAHRLDKRLTELGLAESTRAALGLNAYGLRAPEMLFCGNRAGLQQLVSEQTWRVADPTSGNLAGRFFHPQISRLIYEALVPDRQKARRAQHLARGFEAMLMDGSEAHAFLGWLTSQRSRPRVRGALALDKELRAEVLRATWPCFSSRAIEDYWGILARWHKAVLDERLSIPGLDDQLERWWRAASPEAPSWGPLFQMLWEAFAARERAGLFRAGCEWLSAHQSADAWPHVYAVLLQSAPEDQRLRSLGAFWLEHYPTHQWWPRVWGALRESGFEGTQLGSLAATAIPLLPESDADLAIWHGATLLHPRPADLIGMIIGRLAGIEGIHKMGKGIQLMLRIGPPEALVSPLRSAKEGKAWSLLWRTLADDPLTRDAVLGVGREWLVGRESQPEWTFVWQKLVEGGLERDSVLPLGRDWLAGREERPEWPHVWRTLIEHSGVDVGALLPVGRRWLDGREDQPAWAFVWECLVGCEFELEMLLPLGRDWLAGREDRQEWAHVWECLVGCKFELAMVLPLGRNWLKGREDRPEWSYVWRWLVDQRVDPERLLPLGRQWLHGREDNPGWPHVWRELWNKGHATESLRRIGDEWLGQGPRAGRQIVARVLVRRPPLDRKRSRDRRRG